MEDRMGLSRTVLRTPARQLTLLATLVPVAMTTILDSTNVGSVGSIHEISADYPGL